MTETCTQLGCAYPGSAFHCGRGGCHRTFMYLDEFDMHRQGDVDKRHCVTPLVLGLVLVDDVWSTADHHAVRARLSARLAAARSTKGSE